MVAAVSALKAPWSVRLTAGIVISALCALDFTLPSGATDQALPRQVAVMYHLPLLLLAVAGVADTVAAEVRDEAKVERAGERMASSELRWMPNSVQMARAVKSPSRL